MCEKICGVKEKEHNLIDPINLEVEIEKSENQDCEDFKVYLTSQNKDIILPDRDATADDLINIKMEPMIFKDSQLSESNSKCRYHISLKDQLSILFSNKLFEYGAFTNYADVKYQNFRLNIKN